MAKMGKAKHAKNSQRVKTHAISAPARKSQKKAEKKHTEATAKALSAAKAAPKPSIETQAAKKVSQKLLEAIEKRQQAKTKGPNSFGRPPGRRGRRPKQPIEYVPEHQEDDSYVPENEFERLEYDTGIQLKSGRDDGGFALDRFDDFDEELNFDW